MKRLAVIGKPIRHSISPAIYNAALPALGIDALYEAWELAPAEVGAALERLREPGMLGMNVTVPHKEAVAGMLDQLSDAARAIGAVNCIAKGDGQLIGHNTDVYGFLRSLREAGFEPEGRRALLLGAGGSARAVAYGLAEEGASAILLSGRNLTRVQVLADHLRQTTSSGVEIGIFDWQDETFPVACVSADLVVNCTPVGMRHTDTEADSPLDPSLIWPGAWIYDLVYNPVETVLLRQAREKGAHVVAGLEMLVYQAAESVRLWTDQEPPIEVIRSAAHAALQRAREG